MLPKKVRELYSPGPVSEEDEDLEAEIWEKEIEPEPEPPVRPGGWRARPGRGRARPPEEGRSGVVVALGSGTCAVDCDGETTDCVLPSRLASDQRAAVAVGDVVTFTAHGAEGHRVVEVAPRRTTLSRPHPHNPRRLRVIAANVDLVVHVASVGVPPLRPALIDRCVIATARGGAEPLVCVNKIDLLPGEEERRRELEGLGVYRDMGLQILVCSARTGEGIEALRAVLAGRTAVFVGHSGVGKSSLLNALDPRIDAAIGEVSLTSGRHTTARSSLYRLAGGICLIDTPGIREFGLWKMTAAELRGYFPDFEELAAGCRFHNCTHRHEPECAVQAAVAAGTLDAARHATYLRIYASLDADPGGPAQASR